MPIPFRTVPEHVRNLIVQKLDAHDFGQFTESSKLAFNAASKIRTKLVLSTENAVYVDFNNGGWEFRIKFFGWFDAIEWTIRADLLENTPLKIVAKEINIQGSITQEMCEKLTKTLSRTCSSFGCLRALRFLCTSEAFNNLLAASSAHKLVSPIPKEFIRVSAMKNIDDMEINSPLDDEDLLSLRMRRMHLFGTNVTNTALNTFMHEYYDRKRDFTEVYVQLKSETIAKEIITKGFRVIQEPEAEQKSDTQTEKPEDPVRRLVFWLSDADITLRPSVNMS